MKFTLITKIADKAVGWWRYCSVGVWHDTRRNWKVNVVKTMSLSVRSFFDGDIQSQACAMTYRTMLAIVPALALIFAIGRGFGLQNLIERELMDIFPAQKQAVEYALRFVDSYLNQSSEGVFVGVGLLFLLWTLISLVGNIESTFNRIWGVKQGRSIGRMITDYTAMLLILPVVLVCAGGLSLMLSSTLQTVLDFDFLSPVVSLIVELSSWVMIWLFFTLVYVLIPNTKVKLKNAIIPGIFAGTGFMVLQWVFVTGQMYVARYNAIYGSVSFLPLMLIWMQLVYVVMFAGGVLCYSSQNIFMYSFRDAVRNISSSYYARLTIAIGAVVVQRFVNGSGATTIKGLTAAYNLPPKLITLICDRMVAAGIFSVVEIDSKKEITGYQPAIDPAVLTVAEVFTRLDHNGSTDFIPDFNENFPGVVSGYDSIITNERKITADIMLSAVDIKIPNNFNQ